MQLTNPLPIGVDHPRCPYCHGSLRPEEAKAACEHCMAWHHRECVEAHARCASCGDPLVAGSPARPPRRRRPKFPVPQRGTSLSEAVRPSYGRILVRQLGLPCAVVAGALLGLHWGREFYWDWHAVVAYTHRYAVVAAFVVFSLAWAWIFHERPGDAERRRRRRRRARRESKQEGAELASLPARRGRKHASPLPAKHEQVSPKRAPA